jgi:hypothetical protein
MAGPCCQRACARRSPPRQPARLAKRCAAKRCKSCAGALTREEATGAGLGFIAANFEQIDTASTGKVSFDDVRRYLQQRRK